MNDIKVRYFLWNNKVLEALNENTAIVQNSQTGELMIKKRIDENSIPVMEKLVSIRHKNLCSVLKVAMEDNDTFSYSEYAPGRSIQSFIDEKKIFDENEAVRIISDVCSGLNVLHDNGIIHRDITAANIILSADGNVKIIDYGISRLPKQNVSRDTFILGTAGYAAPEQFGFSQTDARSDIYAVGVLLNVMLTGAFPSDKIYEGKLGKIIRRCTLIDSEKRFSSINELEKELSRNRKLPKERGGIPGFRTDNKLVHILVSLFYLIVALVGATFASVAYDAHGIFACIIQAISYLVSLAVPYCLYLNPLNIKGKIKLFQKCSKQTEYAISSFLSILSIAVGFMLLLILCSSENQP